MREGVNLLVETEDGEMRINYADLDASQTIFLIQFLVEKFEDFSKIPHDEVLEDLKYNKEEGESI